MRKIKSNELIMASEVFSEMFKDYYLYDLFFLRDQKQLKRIYYFFRCESYVAANHLYVEGDFEGLAAIKRPVDKDRSLIGLLSNPFFSSSFVSAVGPRAILLGRKYMNFAQNISKKYYDPKIDCYIKNIGVAERSRGKGLLRKMIDEICKDAPIFLETHTEDNVALYERMGFRVCEQADFHGITHFAMKR